MSAGAFTTLETRRLSLRFPTLDDADEVAEKIGNYDVARWLGRVPYPYARDDALQFIKKSAGREGRVWFIFDETGLQGGISIESELGYWLARDAWGKGYATEAGDAVVDAYFADPDVDDLPSNYFLSNERSGNVLEKLGFTKTKLLRIKSASLAQTVDSQGMILTRDTWAARKRYNLETERLILRELRDTDLPDLQRIGGDARVASMLSSVKSPWPKADVRKWVTWSTYRGRLGGRFAITLKNVFIGTVGVFRIPSGVVSCAYFIDPDHWGQGYATEALGAALRDAIDRYAIETVWADHFEDNPASGVVMRKLGFEQVKTGTGTSAARLEPSPVLIYRLHADDLKARP